MKNFPSIGVQIPEVFLPESKIDPSKWAVIACDQFTSQPEYWQKVSEIVGDSPSTFHLILPEVYLGKPEEQSRVKSTQLKMQKYLQTNILQGKEGLIYVERTVDGKTRRGLMLALDLEKYDFNKGSQSLIRATEGTILDRLPPRIRIRESASLELPHILVLVDDPADTVLGPVESQRDLLPIAYDFDLMLGSGHLTGRFIDNASIEKGIIDAIEALADPATFYPKYQVGKDKGLLLFAVGDGNHSLATAKSIWEKLKPSVGMNHPARYALVEIENVHDKGLEFAPIHRVCFDVKEDPMAAMEKHFGSNISFLPAHSSQQMIDQVHQPGVNEQRFGLITPAGFSVACIRNSTSNLAVGTLQNFLDPWVKNGAAAQIDYVHGDNVVCELGAKPGNIGFYLAGMAKSDLFKTVILDGALPRKTFSMGEAHEKRFYMECRKISE